MTNTPDKSEMKAEFARGFFAGLDHIANFINSLDSSAIYSEWRTARASSRPADQVPEMVEGVAAELAALPVRTEIVNVDTMEKGAQSVEVPLDLRDLILAALKASGEE